MMTAEAAVESLWRDAMGSRDELRAPVFSSSGPDEILPSVFRVTTAATAAIGASSSAAALLQHMRNGTDRRPEVHVDRRHAGIVFRSERYLEIDGAPARGLWEELSG